MTIRGDGSALVGSKNPDDYTDQLTEHELESVTLLTTRLIEELKAEDTVFDTSTGLVEFTHSNPAYAAVAGTDRAERTFREWIRLRMFEIDVSEAMWELAPLVVNGIYEHARGLDG